MSNLERDLRDMLNERADASDATPGDWQDLTVRMARRNKRSRRVLATGLVVALLIGPLAGFAVARAVENDEPTGRVTAAGPGDAGIGSDASSSVSTGEAKLAVRAAYGAQVLLPGTKLDKLFHRTTNDGVTIRAFISHFNANNCQGDGWCPPTDCFPDAAITGELSTDAAVGFANGSHYGGDAPALRATGGGTFGGNGEGSPVRFVVAQSGTDVKKVRVTFEGGGSDEMAPEDGVVLLAARADTNKTGGTIEALDGSGNVIGHADASEAAGTVLGGTSFSLEPTTEIQITNGAADGGAGPVTTTVPAGQNSSDPATPPTVPPTAASGDDSASHCSPPPPSLPAPGEQPGDVPGARAEIEHAFATAYNGGLGNDDEKQSVVQDSDALRSSIDAIRSGSFAQQVKDATAVVTDVVFTSPTEAAVRYDINIANYSDFKDRIGRALLIDGHWKVARVTVCADISLAGATCPAA